MIQPMPFSVPDLIAATDGQLVCGVSSGRFPGVSIDSRNIGKDDLFVAIIGDRHDGHAFIPEVLRRGVKGVILDRGHVEGLRASSVLNEEAACIAVDDTTKALGSMALYQRKRTGVTVTAVTGSSGKTTTRTMISHVVAQRFTTLSTAGNFNNEIGLPLTLLRLGTEHEQAVVELGMNHAGEIKRLARICQPEIGVITNIGHAHLEGVGSIEGVMNAKGELLEEIKAEGTAILNADDRYILKLAEQRDNRTLFYGFSENADIRGIDPRIEGNKTIFTVRFPDSEIEATLNICGDFNVLNALCAAAVGYVLGLPGPEIKAGLELFQPIKGRLNILSFGNGITVVDDTYNANPDSVKCAISIFQSLRKGNRGIFTMGDMFELGDHAEALHHELGGIAAESGITSLYLTGKYAQAVADGAREKKMKDEQIFIGDAEDIIAALKQSLTPGDWLLVKGSRAMKMERIIEGLKETVTNGQ